MNKYFFLLVVLSCMIVFAAQDQVIPGVFYYPVVTVTFERPSFHASKEPLEIEESSSDRCPTRDQALETAEKFRPEAVKNAVSKAQYMLGIYDNLKYQVSLSYSPVYPVSKLMNGYKALPLVRVYVWQPVAPAQGNKHPVLIKYYFEVTGGSFSETLQAETHAKSIRQKAISAALNAMSLKTGIPVQNLKHSCVTGSMVLPPPDTQMGKIFFKFPHVIRI